MKILLIEDDPQMGKGLMRALKDEGYGVDWTRDGNAARRAIDGFSYTTILLDLGLPGTSGIELLRTVRASGNETPILILTAQDDIDTRVTGLDLGADDYLLKPFQLKELLARIRAVLRRRAGSADAELGDGQLRLNLNTRQLTYAGHTELLSAREFALMHALLERPGAILSRERLEEKLYGWGEEVESNAVDVLIYYIRKKFGASIIRNVRGLGWVAVTEKPGRNESE